MVLLTSTPTILETIALLPPSTLTTLNLALPSAPSDPICHSTLITIARLARKHKLRLTHPLQPHSTSTSPSPPPSASQPTTTPKNVPITLNLLLKSSHPYVPPPPTPPPKTPEYTALMARLKAEQERRTYATLTSQPSNPSTFPLTSNTTETENEEEPEDNISPSLVLNILLSIILCAVAVFQITRYYASDGVRVLMSLGVALVVGVAEVGVYSAFLGKVARGRRRERNRRERRVVLGEFTGREGWDAWGNKVEYVEEERREKGGKRKEKEREKEKRKGGDEKMEIWGRGVNGGVRRRVREKWEKEQADENEI